MLEHKKQKYFRKTKLILRKLPLFLLADAIWLHILLTNAMKFIHKDNIYGDDAYCTYSNKTLMWIKWIQQ